MSRYAIAPELAAYLPKLPQLDLADIEAARALAAQRSYATVRCHADVWVREHEIASAARGTSVKVWLYTPTGLSESAPALLYLPGGGFVIPPSAMAFARCAELASELRMIVLLVEYRLAPEHPFPAALTDALTALEWLAAESASIGADNARIGIAGDSAGGALAAGLALWVRDNGGPELFFQYLGIPVLDDRLETHSMVDFVDTPLWNRQAAELSWNYYRPGSTPYIGGIDATKYFAPARHEDLAGLPPTYVSVCEFDPLRDEGIEYAVRLLHAGVTTELHAYPGTFHGSHQLPSAVSRRMERDRTEALRAGLRVARHDGRPALGTSISRTAS
jgi:acetyl esterase/lipase